MRNEAHVWSLPQVYQEKMRANRNVIEGDGYRVTLPRQEDVRPFVAFVGHLVRTQGLTRREAVRRAADRCNIKVV